MGTLRMGLQLGAILSVAGCAGAGIAAVPASYGFVLTKLNIAFYQNDEKIECPSGRSPVVRDAFLETQTPSERARLLKPENARELETKYKEGFVNGPHGTDICTNSALFDTPDRAIQHLGQGKISFGLDLDGAKDDHPAPGTCKHQSYTSPTGGTGIDNQFFRAIACNTFWRGLSKGAGDGLPQINVQQDPVLLVVRDVQSWKNDPHVVVELGSSADKPLGGKIVDDGSFTLVSEPRYRAITTGKIENGVLKTAPVNIVLKTNWVGASGGEVILRHAQLRLTLKPGNSLEGSAGAYRPIDNAVGLLHVGGPGVASTAGVECASVRKTLRILADGDRDPKTGQCSAISQGLEVAAVPAFVFDKHRLAGTSLSKPDAAATIPAASRGHGR